MFSLCEQVNMYLLVSSRFIKDRTKENLSYPLVSSVFPGKSFAFSDNRDETD